MAMRPQTTQLQANTLGVLGIGLWIRRVLVRSQEGQFPKPAITFSDGGLRHSSSRSQLRR